ncbi:GntR family transcriptional regulator [Embleya sp. NBC_00896]|uniref:GntR family transcriptional regulator n=1 Tax=Embleya sp. NBC_00896 TaxID=2975961 RepID=UPI002F918B2B|nr:GntR family transcriptional regulator [Embleya sp. NBC_00896]
MAQDLDLAQPSAEDTLGRLAADRDLLGRAGTAQRVAEVLRDRIAEGALPPGTRLSEHALGAALGVSRNTLREAFRTLVDGRLVVHEMNRGVFVRTLGPDDVVDIYAVRSALEGTGLRAATGAAPERIAALEAAVAGGEAAARAGDWAEVGTADLRFHRALAALAGSARIDEFMNRLLAELRLAFLAMPSARGLHEPFLRRNREIADLLTAGDTDGAAAVLERYLDDARRMICDSMRADGA